MANLTPAAEGEVPAAAYDQVRAALLAVLEPVLDGKLDGPDAINMATVALLQAVPAIRGLPEGAIIKTAAAALVSIGAEIGVDLVVQYPEEAGA